MGPVERLRRWWQLRTGYEETPFDGDMPAWFTSLGVHLALLLLLASLTLWDKRAAEPIVLAAVVEEEREVPPEEYQFTDVPPPEIGALSQQGEQSPAPSAIVEESMTEILTELAPESLVGDLAIEVSPDLISTAIEISEDRVIKGVGTVATTGAAGAVDRITQEILLSLDQRPTLVVWVFDQSGSLRRQRAQVEARFDRVYDELSLIAASGNQAFEKHREKPLLTSVMAFGATSRFMLPQPTDEVARIKSAVRSIEDDDSGRENVCQAIYHAVDTFRRLRVSPKSPRNVLIVAFTDEAGDDVHRHLEPTIEACRRLAMPVYVVGVPAPFGREFTYVKYVDPNPNFDQAPQRAPVHQGPETLYPERLKLHITGAGQRDQAIDSGFGPYGLTRLCYETGGIYFAVHPNRNTGRGVSFYQTAEMSAHLARFFEPGVMRRYRPDYVSINRYKQLLNENQARAALVQASALSWTAPMQDVQLVFPKRSEADLANALTTAQRKAAALEPQIGRICELLRRGKQDRDKLTSPRWRAGYDLAMGQALAVKVRTEGYNAMLAKAKSMKFENERNDTWVLEASGEIDTGSRHAREAQDAITFLNRVLEEHADTPWAHLAGQELATPLGWKWAERFTGVNVPRQNPSPGNGNFMPRDDQRRMLAPPKPRRPPPAL